MPKCIPTVTVTVWQLRNIRGLVGSSRQIKLLPQDVLISDAARNVPGIGMAAMTFLARGEKR